MEHPELGELRPSDEHRDLYEVSLQYRGRMIQLVIDLEGEPFEKVMDFATAVRASLSLIEANARHVACRDLLEVYNNGWNEFDELQPDGSYKTVRNPKLTAQQFGERLNLDTIMVNGQDYLTVCFDEEDLFWGHWIEVRSPSGIDMLKAQADLSG